jgi:DNA-binding GntR family transcriptional regulator
MTDQLDLPQPVFTDPRRVSIELHDHLRTLILDDVLVGGSILSQAELARSFGVSRTPTREAFRMLQEEGLIEAIHNQRARVRELDADEIDQLYATRIVLESLAARITAGRLTEAEIADANATLLAMDAALARREFDRWIALHRRFHDICMCRADEPLTRIIRSYFERSLRYGRGTAENTPPEPFARARASHIGMLAAIVAGDAELAGELTARHVTLTSLAVLRQVNAHHEASAVVHARTMAGGIEP